VLGHLRVRLQEGVRPNAEAQAADALLDRILAPEQLGRQVGHLRDAAVDRPVDRADLGDLGEHLDQALAVEALATRGDELDQRLPRVAPLAHDEVPQVALLRALVVRREPFLACPGGDPVTDGVAGVARQPAAIDREDLVPAPGPVQAQDRAVVAGRERVLHLVAVVELRDRRDDRLDRRVREPGEALERVRHPLLLRRELSVVGEVLEAAPPAGGVVRARRVDAQRSRRDDRGRDRLGVAALHLRHARADRVAWKPASHEDDEAVEPGNAVAAVRERVDRELELLVALDGGGHGWRLSPHVPGTLVPGTVATPAR